MKRIVIDARGTVCPKPLILTRKQLQETPPAETFVLLVDNDTSKENVERFLSDNRIMFQTSRQGDTSSILITKPLEELDHPEAEDFCRPAGGLSGRHVYCFTGDQMGSGPAELGQILIQACINTIREVEPRPAALVFYNSGVRLTTDDSPVLQALQALEKSGVSILVCGTCANFFQIKEQVSVGSISNMYTILETLSRAGHVISP
ncbi:MAG: sulfurtransferase-like selenium metabolism protein YedF [Desulfocapsaceae bacterium]|nr:sulfurtransferase-like selenium metabolism protein YedF [Desulfocapsaceae bacterium]